MARPSSFIPPLLLPSPSLASYHPKPKLSAGPPRRLYFTVPPSTLRNMNASKKKNYVGFGCATRGCVGSKSAPLSNYMESGKRAKNQSNLRTHLEDHSRWLFRIWDRRNHSNYRRISEDNRLRHCMTKSPGGLCN